MKKIFILLVSLFAMMAASLSATAQEITITLNPGWNWISYPNAEAMQIGEALGDFVPMEGDRIRSKFGMSSYGGGRWRGAVTHFIPGWGYQYYSSRTEYVELVFVQPASNVVATASPTDITATSAFVGGMVMLPEGTHVFLRGVCWGTMPSPDIDSSHTTEETGIGSFSSTLEGLNPNTTYFVRAYAVSDHGLAYGNEVSFTTLSGIPVVTTAEVTDITGNSVLCGGTVTDDGGLTITARGVCWSTSHNPTLSDSHTTDGTGTGSFTSSLTGLSANTTYYVRAYASNSLVTIYGGEQSFTTEAGGGGGGDHAYIDLGLPSGLLWATCNVGADSPEDYGDYFAWGETQPKDTYNWSTYQYCMGCENTLTMYCTDPNFGYNAFYDDLTTLLPEDDAATVNWGSDWRMPTYEEWEELYINTTVTWTTQNGVNGWLFTASNGNSLFLPAAGCCSNSSLIDAGSYAFCWSSSLGTDYPYAAWGFYFDSSLTVMNYDTRFFGHSVRAVRGGSQNTSFSIDATASPSEGGTVTGSGNYAEGSTCTLIATANEGYTFTNWTENGVVVSTDATYSFTMEIDRVLVANFAVSSGNDHAYVDLGLPSGLLWATCNVGADTPEDYGDYFAWGETQSKNTYNWYTYQYCNGSDNTFTKYCSNSSYGYNGFTDNLTTLLPEDDAAAANWGSGWRMPTKKEWRELFNNTTVTLTTQNGVNGHLFTASNGNSLFLPATGCRYYGTLFYGGSCGFYWSSSLHTNPDHAWYFYFDSDNYGVYVETRNYGLPVRPVRVGLQN